MKESIDFNQKFQAGVTYEEFIQSAGVHRARYLKTYANADVGESDREFFSRLPGLFIIVMAETWCTDVSAILPVVVRAIEGIEKIKLKICLRSAHKDLMDNYLTGGKAAMPKLIFLDEQYSPVANWGPRPATVLSIFEDNRSKLKWGLPGKYLIFRKTERFYKQDRGKEVLREIRLLLEEYCGGKR